MCLGNCPGCSTWPGEGKDLPLERWVPEAGASRNKISLCLAYFPYLFLGWVLWILLSFFLTWKHSLNCCTFTLQLDTKDLLNAYRVACAMANMKDLHHMLLPSKTLYSRMRERDDKYPRAADLKEFISYFHFMFLHKIGLFCLV